MAALTSLERFVVATKGSALKSVDAERWKLVQRQLIELCIDSAIEVAFEKL
jgi:hypothetical protein